jgi:hypothetical protein
MKLHYLRGDFKPGIPSVFAILTVLGLLTVGSLNAGSATFGRKYLNATTYQILTTDFILSVSSTNNAVTLTLPASTTTNSGFQLIIKDKNGVSETNNITIAGKGSNTIDGGSTAVLNSNYSSITLTSDGANNWEVN